MNAPAVVVYKGEVRRPRPVSFKITYRHRPKAKKNWLAEAKVFWRPGMRRTFASDFERPVPPGWFMSPGEALHAVLAAFPPTRKRGGWRVDPDLEVTP